MANTIISYVCEIVTILGILAVLCVVVYFLIVTPTTGTDEEMRGT